MFTIKFVRHDGRGYNAHEAEHFKVRYLPGGRVSIFITKPDGEVDVRSAGARTVPTDEPDTYESTDVFIENAAGKTIDVFRTEHVAQIGVDLGDQGEGPRFESEELKPEDEGDPSLREVLDKADTPPA